MPITVIDKIKQKSGDFKLLDASDINWDIDVPSDSLPDNIPTKDEVNQSIADAVAGIDALTREVLAQGSTLPSTGNSNTIYMLPKADGTYIEYMYVNNKWEIIGNNDIDLTNYPTTSTVNNLINSAKSELKTYADTAETDAVAAAKTYTDQEKAKYLPLSGGRMTGKITGVVTPTADTDAASKAYVDAVAAGVTPANMLTVSDFSTGTTNGSFLVKNTTISIAGLKSAAYHEASDFLTIDRLTWTDIG